MQIQNTLLSRRYQEDQKPIELPHSVPCQRRAANFAARPAPNLRSLAVLPQDDRMVLALDP